MAKKKREKWTAEAARAELEAWRRSGLSMAEHCRRRGIRPEKLYWWRRRLTDDGADAGDAPLRWVEAAITGISPAAAVTIRLGNGDCVEIGRPRDVDIAWLRLLIAGLQAAS